jgi:branched-chain amino acid aminotransferase
MAAGGPIVWLSGRYLPDAEARVPATSDTVLLGVGAFETMRLVRGVAPLLEHHLARLRCACSLLSLKATAELRRAEWDEVIRDLAARNGLSDGVARITVGQGFTLVTTRPLPPRMEAERCDGVALSTWGRARGAPALKGTARLDLWLAERTRGGEVLLVDPGGRVLESSRANFFAVTRQGLQTAAAADALPGVARAIVIEEAQRLGLLVTQDAPCLPEVGRWREAFLTNAVSGVRPVARIDDIRLDPPGPGSLTRTLQRALDARAQVA